MRNLSKLLAVSSFALAVNTAQAGEIVFDNWTTNQGISGNYSLTIDDNTAGVFNYSVDVNPWNAEVFGLFIDLGNFDVPGATGFSTTDSVSLVYTDTSSNSCGAGCNLNGLSPSLTAPDAEWEMVFRVGTQGFNGIQSFSFTTSDFGLTLNDFVAAGVRAQQLCDAGEVLPNGNCDGSDKSYSATPTTPVPPPSGGPTVSEPGVLTLMALALALAGFSRRKA